MKGREGGKQNNTYMVEIFGTDYVVEMLECLCRGSSPL